MPNKASIADASGDIQELISILDNAYWETATIERKDLIYSIIALLGSENTEINKLSIQDNHLPYEPISEDFRELKNKLNQLRKMMDEVVMRSVTARALDRLIPKITSLLN